MPARPSVRQLAVLGVALGATLLALGSAPIASARDAGPPRPVRRVHAVGVRVATLVDPSRPTPEIPAVGLSAAAARTLPVTVWYPARGPSGGSPIANAPPIERRRLPFIVWAHGNGSRGALAPALVRSWASLGYVVAAPDFPASSRARSTLAALDDWGAQPGDVAFVIDTMLSGRGIAGLGRLVDERHIGIAGHSLGAITALAVAYGEHADRRVDAVTTFAGVALLDGTDRRAAALPMLLVHGSDDVTIPAANSRAVFDRATGRRFLVTVVGGGHSALLYAPDPETSESLATATAAFWAATLDRGPDPGRAIAALETPGRFEVASAGAPLVDSAGSRR
ncbi:MAG: lipase [Acidimicrobiia bacterium]